MKIAIIGTGGVGGYFGGKLANAGNDVTFVARGKHLKEIITNGLKIKSIDGDFEINPTKATSNIKEIEKVDLVIIAVKAWQIKDVAKDVKFLIDSNTVVLPLQNGVLAVDELSEVLPSENIISGLCKIFSKIEAPGVINHVGFDPIIIFGEQNNQKTERVDAIKQIFDNAGFKSKIATNIKSELWMKFIGICNSGLIALTRSPYGVLREVDETNKMMRDLMTEICTVAIAEDIEIPNNFVDKFMTSIYLVPYNSTCSLSRDVMEGKPSEIEYQNGTVVKLAKKHNIHVPVNRFIYSCILPMEKVVRGFMNYNS